MTREKCGKRVPSPGPGDFPGQLKVLRALRGMKQSTLARLVGVHEITVSRWERGRSRPTLRQQVRLCEELRVAFHELGLDGSRSTPSAVSLAETSAPAACLEDESDVRRREFLRGALAFGGALAFAPVDWEHLTAAMGTSQLATAQLVSDMHGVTREHLRLCHAVAPSALLPAVESHLLALRRLHGAPAHDMDVAARTATAHTAMLSAWLFMESGDRATSRSRFGLAEELATDLQHPSLQAQILTACSYLDTGVAAGRRSSRALALLDEAESLVPSGPSCVRAYVHARRSEERAAGGDAPGAECDLEAAEQCLDDAIFDPDAIYAYRDEERWLDAYRASVYRLLGRHSDAALAASRAIPTLRPHHQAPALCDQAAGVASRGDLDAACALLVDATRVATSTGNLTYLDRVRGIRAGVVASSSAHVVHPLDELLGSVTA